MQHASCLPILFCFGEYRQKWTPLDCGHMTGQVDLAAQAPPNQRVGTTQFLSWRCDLAKLNLKCHMNHSFFYRN